MGQRRGKRTARLSPSLPIWQRDKALLRRIEKFGIEVRPVSWFYGSRDAWRRIRNLLTVPPDQWGSLRRCDLPTHMPQYDMSCTGCCDRGCCCDIPATLYVDIELPAESTCLSCFGTDGPLVDFPITCADPSTLDCDGEPPIQWLFQGFGNGPTPCSTGNEDSLDIMCGICSITVECTDGGEGGSTELDTSLATVECTDDLFTALDVESCEPFLATATVELTDIAVNCICFSDNGGETWNVTVHE